MRRQEILDAGELLWQDYKEPNAVNILNQLLEDNGCPPSIGLRLRSHSSIACR